MQHSASVDAATARVALETYFRRLEDADFAAATRCFTVDAAYSHPPFPGEGADGARHETRGREALLAVFQRRGRRTLRHRVDAVLVQGELVLASGVVEDDGRTIMSFVAEALIDSSSGLIRRYAAYASVPAVWSVLEEKP